MHRRIAGTFLSLFMTLIMSVAVLAGVNLQLVDSPLLQVHSQVDPNANLQQIGDSLSKSVTETIFLNDGLGRIISRPIIIRMEYNLLANGRFQFRFNADAPLHIPGTNPNLRNAVVTVSTSTTANGVFTPILTQTINNPSWIRWYSVDVAPQTAHFRFTVNLNPVNGSMATGSPLEVLLNRSGVRWQYNHTCPVTGRRITPPPTNWTRVSYTRVQNYRTTYVNWVRNNFDPNFNLTPDVHVHHIRPLNLGGTNIVSNLIHLPETHHRRISGWFNGY